MNEPGIMIKTRITPIPQIIRAAAGHWAILLGVMLVPVLSGGNETAKLTERFVWAKHGNDKNDGTSWTNAWETMARAFNKIDPGATVTIGPGVYHESISYKALRGTKEAPIVVRARFPGSVVLSGFLQITDFKLAAGKKYTYEILMNATNIPDPTIAVEPDTGTRLREMPAPDIVEEVLGSFYVDRAGGKLYVHRKDGRSPCARGILVSRSKEGITLSEIKSGNERIGPTFVTIEGLEICGYSYVGLHVRNPRDVTIQDCVIHDCGQGIWFRSDSYRTQVLRCDTFRNYWRHMESGNIEFKGRAIDCLVRDCRVHDTDLYGVRTYGGLLNEESYPGTVFERNIIWNTQAFPIGYKGGKSKVATIRNNVFFSYSHNVPVEEYNTVEYTPQPGTIGNLYFGDWADTNVIKYPKFVDPINRDYRLQSDSPARGKGPNGTDLGAYPYKGNVFFVRPDGDDSAEGTSEAKAWKSLAQAAKRAKAGETVIVMTGTYTEPLVPANSGSPDQPIIFRARGDSRVVINGGSNLEYGIDLRKKSYLCVEGFIVHGCKRSGIVAGGEQTRGAKIIRCVSCHNQGDGIVINGPTRAGFISICTAVSNRNFGLRITGKNEGLQITGNILGGDTASIAIESDANPELYVDYNNYSQDRKNIGAWNGKIAVSLEEWRRLTGLDDRSISADPLFIAPNADDFRIAKTSPCRGAGPGSYDIGAGAVDTSKSALEIRDLKAAGILSTTAAIGWWTEACEGNTCVEYGATPQLGEEKSHMAEDVAFHHTALTGLKPDTVYYYRVITQNPGWLLHGNPEFWNLEKLMKRDSVTSSIQQFRTPAIDPKPKTYYVSLIKGKEGNDGLSPDTAFQRIRPAAERAVAGDTVMIEPGLYYETLMPLNSGTAEKPIVFKSAGWQPVILEGKHIAQSLIRLIGVEHIYFQGFHLHGSAHHQYRGYFGGAGYTGMVWMDKTDDIRFRYCLFDGRGSYVQTALQCAIDPRQTKVIVEDSAFLGGHTIFQIKRQAAEFNHCVFGIANFGQIHAREKGARVGIRNTIVTGSIQQKMHCFGYMARSKDGPEAIRSDYNGFWFQPYDKFKWIAVLNDDLDGMVFNEKVAKLYRGDEGLPQWRKDTGNDTHSIIGEPDFVTYKGAADWKSEKQFDGCEDPNARKKVTWLDDFRLGPASSFKGKGEGKRDLGIRFPE